MSPNIPLRVRNLVRRYAATDPYRIAKDMRCEVMLAPLPDHINGMWRRILRRKYIFINDRLEEWQQAAVLCHELGHILMHPGYCAYSLHNVSYSRTRYEDEADAFAARLMAYRYDESEIYVGRFLSESWIK